MRRTEGKLVRRTRLCAKRELDRSQDALCLCDRDLIASPRLKEAIKRAEEEFKRVSTTFPTDYLTLFLTPSYEYISPEEAKALIELLPLRSDETGLTYENIVEYDGKQYRVWIRMQPCG